VAASQHPIGQSPTSVVLRLSKDRRPFAAPPGPLSSDEPV